MIIDYYVAIITPKKVIFFYSKH